MFRALFALPLVLAACMTDETVSGFVNPETSYVLSEINGVPYSSHAQIAFPEKGRISGSGPCNSFSAEQSSPYPWLSVGPMRATLLACQQKSEEQLFFKTLASMTQVEAQGDTLILRNDDNSEMVFRAHQP